MNGAQPRLLEADEKSLAAGPSDCHRSTDSDSITYTLREDSLPFTQF